MPAPWGTHAAAFALDGRVCHVAVPTVQNAISLLLADEPVFFVIAAMRDDADRMWLIERVMDPEKEFEESVLDLVVDGLVENWFGLKRWTVERLWREALDSWLSVDAEMFSRGVDVMELPHGRATSLVMHTLAKRHQNTDKDKNRLSRWQGDLDRAPLRVGRQQARVKTAASAWLAAAQQARGM